MEFPDNLIVHLEERHKGQPDWWVEQYKVAVERLEDHVHDDDPYINAPAAEFDLLCDDNELRDIYGASYTPEELRKMAFEMLALADLAEME